MVSFVPSFNFLFCQYYIGPKELRVSTCYIPFYIQNFSISFIFTRYPTVCSLLLLLLFVLEFAVEPGTSILSLFRHSKALLSSPISIFFLLCSLYLFCMLLVYLPLYSTLVISLLSQFFVLSHSLLPIPQVF